MSNVFQFKNQGTILKEQLMKIIQELEEVYQGLDLAVDAITKLEDIAQVQEQKYNKVLRKYATEVGEENVEVGLLDYATEVEIVVDLDGLPILKFDTVIPPEQFNLFPEDD
jgi:hypothetical protein